jgi:hypothetical protein
MRTGFRHIQQFTCMGMSKQQLADHLTKFIDSIDNISAYGPWINEARSYRQRLSHIRDDDSEETKLELDALARLTDSVAYDLNRAYERAREAKRNKEKRSG